MMSILSGGRRQRWRDLTPNQRRTIAARLRRDKALSRMINIATEGKWPPTSEPEGESADDVQTTEERAKAAAQVAAGDETQA
jgi:hypothetical protein